MLRTREAAPASAASPRRAKRGGFPAATVLLVVAAVLAITTLIGSSPEHVRESAAAGDRAGESSSALASSLQPVRGGESSLFAKLRGEAPWADDVGGGLEAAEPPVHAGDALEGDPCGRDVFVVHWTHVPKAGGTAFASLAKRVACAKNPHLAASNPCCVKDMCVAEGSCFASASTCPLVQGIGRHTSHMGRLPLVPCCGREWYMSTVVAFLRLALKPPPTTEDLALYGLEWDGNGGAQFGSASKRKSVKSIAAIAGDSKSAQLALRVISYKTWPLHRRVEFFSRTGIGTSDLASRYGEFARARPTNSSYGLTMKWLAQLARSVAPSGTLYGTIRASDADMVRFPRPSEPTRQARACAAAARALDDPGAELTPESVCCHKGASGANSMTMLRAPLARGLSAYFYRGHSPNFDAYQLRPGLWIPPAQKSKYPAYIRNKHWTYKEYVNMDEYQNTLTKMFGDSTGCPSGKHCDRTLTSTCPMTTGCHGYRNASAYLNSRHVDSAVANLEKHAFFGLLEAYNASVLLAAHKFDLTDLDADDFAHSRASNQLNRKCSPSRTLRLDASVCRYAFTRNSLDNVVFERAHRIFCDRLSAAGLRQRPDIARDLVRNRLCTSFDYSNIEDVCGSLETPERIEKFLAERANCRGHDKRYWINQFGFFWEPNR